MVQQFAISCLVAFGMVVLVCLYLVYQDWCMHREFNEYLKKIAPYRDTRNLINDLNYDYKEAADKWE